MFRIRKYAYQPKLLFYPPLTKSYHSIKSQDEHNAAIPKPQPKYYLIVDDKILEIHCKNDINKVGLIKFNYGVL